MEGFEDYLSENDIIDTVDQYFENRDNRYSEYVAICMRIKKKIRKDQINGGMAGIYNPSITQRLNNLVERTDITSDDEQIKAIMVDGRSKDI